MSTNFLSLFCRNSLNHSSLAVLLTLLVGVCLMGRQNPTAQTLPYTQNFGTFTGLLPQLIQLVLQG
jgi:hypothetical protein